MRCLIAILAAWSIAAPAAAKAPDEVAILAAVQRFFDALSSQDGAAMARTVLPGGIHTSVASLPDGRLELRRRPADGPIAAGLHERMWNPVVTQRGALAVVWTPYEFQRDGKTTHCGVDVFNLVKDGEWKIAGIAWTVEPDACAELGAR